MSSITNVITDTASRNWLKPFIITTFILIIIISAIIYECNKKSLKRVSNYKNSELKIIILQ